MSVTPRVLIVDDEPDACTGLRRILRMDGYDVDIAHSVAEMLGPREWANYLAILLDRKLPDGTAEEFLPELKRRAPHAAIVIVTGYADMQSSIAAFREGAEDYIIKPINPDMLRATLARINRVRQAEERARQAERLAAIGEVTTSLAHESRNFLQRICSAIDFLKELEQDNPEAMQEIVRIQAAEQGLEHLLEELRQFAAPINLDKECTSVRTVWRRAWSSVTRGGNGNAPRFDEMDGDDDFMNHVDTFRLEQVFRNLFENSLAASPEQPAVAIQCETVDRMMRLSVRDNGPGLGPEQRANVFQPFFTTKADGTGLGMAIAKRIIEAHGGSICVGDSCEAGAEFVITLPLESGASS